KLMGEGALADAGAAEVDQVSGVEVVEGQMHGQVLAALAMGAQQEPLSTHDGEGQDRRRPTLKGDAGDLDLAGGRMPEGRQLVERYIGGTQVWLLSQGWCLGADVPVAGAQVQPAKAGIKTAGEDRSQTPQTLLRSSAVVTRE